MLPAEWIMSGTESTRRTSRRLGLCDVRVQRTGVVRARAACADEDGQPRPGQYPATGAVIRNCSTRQTEGQSRMKDVRQAAGHAVIHVESLRCRVPPEPS